MSGAPPHLHLWKPLQSLPPSAPPPLWVSTPQQSEEQSSSPIEGPLPRPLPFLSSTTASPQSPLQSSPLALPMPSSPAGRLQRRVRFSSLSPEAAPFVLQTTPAPQRSLRDSRPRFLLPPPRRSGTVPNIRRRPPPQRARLPARPVVSPLDPLQPPTLLR